MIHTIEELDRERHTIADTFNMSILLILRRGEVFRHAVDMTSTGQVQLAMHH